MSDARERKVDISGYKLIISVINRRERERTGKDAPIITGARLARAVGIKAATVNSWLRYPDNLISEENAETLRRALDIVLEEIGAGITADGLGMIEVQRLAVCDACKASIDQYIEVLMDDARSMQKLEEYARMLYRNLWPTDPAFYEFPAPDRSGVPYIPWEKMTDDQRATICSDFDAGMQRAAEFQKPHEEAARLHDHAVEVMRLPVRDPDGRTWSEYEEQLAASKPSRDVRRLREWIDAYPGDDRDTEEYKQASAALTLAEIEEERQASWRSSVNIEPMDEKALREWRAQLIDYDAEDQSLDDDQASAEADQ